MRKEIDIKVINKSVMKQKLFNRFNNDLNSFERKKLKENIDMFLEDPIYFRKNPEFKEFWKIYSKEGIIIKHSKEGRSYRNNKIFDMSYEVLTHETSASKMLNPGGFKPQSKMGYLVEAYRNSDESWESLEKLSIGKLKEKSYVNKNLCFIDTHVQFYKQNNAAGTLLGSFAVHKVAHALLENNGFLINIEDLCELTHPQTGEPQMITICNSTFGGMKEIDATFNDEKFLIGKILGSLVASAADAVKDPVLNLMNINSNTSNVLVTMIRLGMPFEDTALFLSQKIITDVVNEYNSRNITEYTSLKTIIEERLAKISKDYSNVEQSQLEFQSITKEELIQGIKETTPEMTYKVLLNFIRLQKIGNALQSISAVTRLNSISNAVGPLIVDNLILENKLNQISDYIYLPGGQEPADLTDVLDMHPILKEFYKTLPLAKEIFAEMPSNSRQFRSILDSLDENTKNIILRDRKLLTSLSDFYQSYLLVASGVINPNHLEAFITKYPKEFFARGYKSKYPNNKLIQAIQLEIDRKSNNPVLKINTTGMDITAKEQLGAAWTDLYKNEETRDIAIALFRYNFFKGGIVYSPKTFMGLLPTYIKSRLEGYIETFENEQSIINEILIDQFIRNNSTNNKLVPKKKDLKNMTIEDNIMTIDINSNPSLIGVSYFKDDNNIYHLIAINDDNIATYEVLSPLGNNKEYLEIHTENIETSLNSVVINSDIEDDSEIQVPLEQELEYNDSQIDTFVFQAFENVTKDSAVAYAKIQQYKGYSKEEQQSKEDKMKAFFRKQFDKLNIKFNETIIEKAYKTIC